MAGLSIKVEDAQLQKILKQLIAGLTDGSPIMRAVGEVVIESVLHGIEVGGEPQRWKPLAPATIERKGHDLPLRGKSGNLARIAVRPEAWSVVVGPSPSAKAYAAIQHLGGKAGRGRKVTIPARPYLRVTEGDLQEIQELVTDYIRRFTHLGN